MTPSSTLIDTIKTDEGWVPHAYQDHLGFWTIGYGFLIDERRGGGIPEPVAEYWLQHILQQNADALVERIPWLLDQPDEIQQAVQNMAYQLGVSGVMQFRNMLSALRRGDREEAAEHALDSRWAKQTPNRAARVAALIRGA